MPHLQRQSVKAVAMDIKPSLIHAARQRVLQLDIVHDAFRIFKYLEGAVLKARK
jgi:transposase